MKRHYTSLLEDMEETMSNIKEDINKNTKAAEARVRKETLKFAKLGKAYRKLSVDRHKE